MMRVLIDTNIVLDFVLARQPFFTEADQIFFRLRKKEFEAFVSAITPINVFYTTRKETDKATAFTAVDELLKLVEIARSDNRIYKNALSLNFKDYEDAVQHECAVAENLDAIVTRNAKDYQNASIRIYSPAEFLQTL
ncbi:MAG: PIN domain-containing protein [Acidobacteria bacterium]|nr:PIN domain-containing protein [Acidobacteriota bacterium]